MLSNMRRASISKQQQLFNHFWRTLSTTSLLGNVKTLSHDTTPSTEHHSLTSAGAIDSKYLQSILAEWDHAKPFSKVPGPSRFQVMRGFMKGGEFEKLSLIELVNRCRQKYGDVCLIPGSFGQPPLLSIFNPVDFERVHRTEGKWPVRPGAEAISYYRKNRKDGFFNESQGLAGRDQDWAHVRSTVNPVLMKPQNARLYLEPLLRISSEFVQRIREIRDPITQEVPDNFVDDINHLTFESIAAVSLDKELGLVRQTGNSAEAQQLFDSSHIFIKSIYELGVKPSLYLYFRTPTYRRFEKAMDTVFDICKKYVDEAMERVKHQTDGSGEGRSVLEKLLKIDRKLAVVMALDLMQSGVEPTTSVLSGALLLIAKNPEKQAKLRTEIMNAVSTDKNAKFSIENMHNLPYLRACIKESLRLYPITSGNFRETGMDIVLGGYRIPKNTRVIINSNLLLTEERHFPRPHDFIPERWMRGDADRLVSDTMSPFVYLPFGFGPRTCVGKRIVDLELELTLANLVRNFKIEFNYPTDKAFKCIFINTPAIPLKFKFTDL